MKQAVQLPLSSFDVAQQAATRQPLISHNQGYHMQTSGSSGMAEHHHHLVIAGDKNGTLGGIDSERGPET